jgi:2-polyprenyl-6-methoxyphenol hydroxylase-like FAD-dependent oxidoreductase
MHNEIAFMEKLDVVVIGAGPVGLATAIGLRKRGLENLLVVDQTRAFRQVGQTVDLLPNGLKALKYLDSQAYEQIKEVGNRFLNPKPPSEETVKTTPGTQPPKTTREWVQKNLRGERISSFSLNYDDWFQEYGEGRTSISWYNLQTTLRQLLPQEQVRPNHRCINIVDESDTGYVRVDCVSDTTIEANPYAHWTEEQKPEENPPQNLEKNSQQLETKSFRAKLIVAADGINSTVRQILYKDSPYSAFAKPEYSGYAAIACSQIIDIPDNLKLALEETFFQGSPVITIRNDEISEDSHMEVPRMILFHRPNGPVGYVIHHALPLNILQGKSGKTLIDIAVPALEKAGFPDVLKQLVSLSTPANMQQRPYYIHRASVADSLQLPSTAFDTEDNRVKIQPPWSSGRVVLVGDAAHGMPPFMAQGANQGLEDALVITTLIANIAREKSWDDTQAINQAFEKYEHFRHPLIIRVQQATLQQLSQSRKKEWQEYSDLVFRREFEQMLPVTSDQ